MKEFQLLLTNLEYEYILVGTSFRHPLHFVNDAKKFLQENNFQGFVLIDALTSKGFASNRFMTVYFNGEKFDVINSEVTTDVSKELSDLLYEFYRDNYSLIENNQILSKPQKFLLRKGRLIKN